MREHEKTIELFLFLNLQSWTKVLGTVLPYSYVSIISRFPIQSVHLFRIFLQFSLPPSFTKLKLGKKILDTSVQHCLWGEGKDWTCVNRKTPQKCKSVPRLLSMIVETVFWNSNPEKKANISRAN